MLCKGITKEGERCSNNAKILGYCIIHFKINILGEEPKSLTKSYRKKYHQEYWAKKKEEIKAKRSATKSYYERRQDEYTLSM